MSYASVAANNAPPADQQPRPDPALLNTDPQTNFDNDSNSKVNVVPNPASHHPHDDDDDIDNYDHKKKPNRRLKEVEAEGLYLWHVTKQYLFRPGVAGGLIGLVNFGLLAAVGRAFYTQPHLRRDSAAISSTAAAGLVLLSVEGYAAEKYRKTDRGRAEEKHAREEGTLIYRHLREQILRPGVLGGIVGLLNTAVLGTVGYFSYIHWDRPTWDRRVVSAVTVGLAALWGGEAYLAQHHNK